MHELPPRKEAATPEDLRTWVRSHLEAVIRIDPQGPSDLRRLLAERQGNTVIGMPSQNQNQGRREA